MISRDAKPPILRKRGTTAYPVTSYYDFVAQPGIDIFLNNCKLKLITFFFPCFYNSLKIITFFKCFIIP